MHATCPGLHSALGKDTINGGRFAISIAGACLIPFSHTCGDTRLPKDSGPPDKLPPRTLGLYERLLYGGFISPFALVFFPLPCAFLITLLYSVLSTSLYYLLVAHNGSHSACSHCIRAPSPLRLLPFVSTLPRLIDASAGRSAYLSDTHFISCSWKIIMLASVYFAFQLTFTLSPYNFFFPP